MPRDAGLTRYLLPDFPEENQEIPQLNGSSKFNPDEIGIITCPLKAD